MKLHNIRKLLIQLKEKLVKLDEEPMTPYDFSQIEYLIKLIDWFLTSKISLNPRNFNIFLEELMNTCVMQLRFELLDYVKPFHKSLNRAINEGELDEIQID